MVERFAVGNGFGGVALAHGFDQVAFDLGFVCGDGFRFFEGCPGGGLLFRRHDRLALGRDVDVRAGDQRFAPEAHGAGGIELLCGAEGADRFSVVEAEAEHHALVEIALGAGVCRRDGAAVLAHALEQRRPGAGDEFGVALGLRRAGGEDKDNQES